MGMALAAKMHLADTDWFKANGLAGVGYTDLSAIVDGAGGAQSNVWKWLNLSQYKVDGTQLTFKVEAGSLTKTFQIGGRENGLYFDKFVFAKSNQVIYC
jgi:endo-1,4-beta-xylanase